MCFDLHWIYGNTNTTTIFASKRPQKKAPCIETYYYRTLCYFLVPVPATPLPLNLGCSCIEYQIIKRPWWKYIQYAFLFFFSFFLRINFSRHFADFDRERKSKKVTHILSPESQTDKHVDGGFAVAFLHFISKFPSALFPWLTMYV